MDINLVMLAIVLGAIVTWIPRVFPFVLVKYRQLPQIVVRFLHYLPLTIIFALALSSLFEVKAGNIPQLKGLDTLAALPTLYVAFRFRNLLWTVLVGIISMAALRLVF